MAGGAWCPAQPIVKDSAEYLEIDLGRLMVVTMVETQGRFDNGQVSRLDAAALKNKLCGRPPQYVPAPAS